MYKSEETCESTKTAADKIWPYEQYHVGSKDDEKRRKGLGENHWTGADSMESYTGTLLRDCMHGQGDYRWRYRGAEGSFVTYEGHFYNNRLHGYGTMSYPEGRTFDGLFHTDIRWGPGIESFQSLRENVGLWRGTQLVRLAWQPPTPSVTPDLYASLRGQVFVSQHRVLLTGVKNTIGEVNSALELLKQCGAKPVVATAKWKKLYPKHCTDLESQMCHVDVFDHSYYKGNVHELEEVSSVPEIELEPNKEEGSEIEPLITYFAWNNSKTMIHMMQHCYKHDNQLNRSRFKLAEVMMGPRSDFKPAGKHELDCRTLLMASYLGHITYVAQLVNESGVNPNVADIQGNSAIMYAASGEQDDIIHFLVEAGADVDSYNDACCTPLGVVLTKFACTQRDVPLNVIVQAILPQELEGLDRGREKVCEWKIVKEFSNILQRTPSKLMKPGLARAPSAKKIKSSMSIKDLSKKKPELAAQKSSDMTQHESLETFSEENRVQINILNEFIIRVNDALILPIPANPISYLFELNDLVAISDTVDDEQKKLAEKVSKKVPSKVIKDTIKRSKDKMWQSGDESESISSSDKQKSEMSLRMMTTIKQLLDDGADPCLVCVPQPALFTATISGCSQLIRLLIERGADVNETYPQAFNYTPLDVAISGPFTHETLDLIRTLFDCGACADRRLSLPIDKDADRNIPAASGPTLLHAVLAKKVDSEYENDVRQEILELLLQNGCDPIAQYKGRSAIDVAMSKSMDILDIFIKASPMGLNEIINVSNQTILVKMFSLAFCKNIPIIDRLQTLTNLILYGADPLLNCQNGEETYDNLFVFAKNELENTAAKPQLAPPGKNDPKGKKTSEKAPSKPKKDDKPAISTKSLGKLVVDERGDYIQALDLVIECARLLYIRWLQAMLMKELIEVIDKYKHRAWVMILREIKNKKRISLWLTAVRCLEIWDTLKTTKKKKYNDEKILRHALCIVHYLFKNSKEILRSRQVESKRLKAQEMEEVESEVDYFVQEHSMTTSGSSGAMPPWKCPYVKPELIVKGVAKFNVCFECVLPFDESRILCSSCKLVSFCSLQCLQENIPRFNCHPCSPELDRKYFPEKYDSDDC